MTGVVIGKVLDISLDGLTIEDHITKEKIKAFSESDDVLELTIGDTGIFVGNLYNNSIRIKRYEIRKFLDPLYEEDLFDASGKFTLIPVVDNPFTDTYLKFMEKRKEQEEKAQEEADEESVDTTTDST